MKKVRITHGVNANHRGSHTKVNKRNENLTSCIRYSQKVAADKSTGYF